MTPCSSSSVLGTCAASCCPRSVHFALPQHNSFRTLLALALLFSACGDSASSELIETVAELEVLRGAGAQSRHGVGDSVTGQLARLRLDSGATALLGDASVTIDAQDAITVESGKVFLEVAGVDALTLSAGGATFDIAPSSAVDVDVESQLYVIRGQLTRRLDSGERVLIRAGEALVLATGEAVPVSLWNDWTGGLALPSVGRARAPIPTLAARVPGESGMARWPLSIRRFDVSVRFEGNLATTEIEQVFFNPASEAVEGEFRFNAPEGAVLHRFAVDRNGVLVDGYIREKQQAQAAYQAQVYRGSTLDPALLEWVAPGQFKARIYPIAPGAERRIAVRYSEWLGENSRDNEARRVYTLPLASGDGAPSIQEFRATMDLSGLTHEGSMSAGYAAALEGDLLTVQASDFRPGADWTVEFIGDGSTSVPLQRVGSTLDEGGPDFVRIPLRLPDSLFDRVRSESLDVVLISDVSAATDAQDLELGRATVEAIATHLGPDDRLAIVASDAGLRQEEVTLTSATAESIGAALDVLAREPSGGASDLGATFVEAATLLEARDEGRPGVLVYIGDGAPTVGELGQGALLRRLSRLANPVRAYAVAVGEASELGLLEAVTRGGGIARRVLGVRDAAEVALEILAHAKEPVAQRVTVEIEGLEGQFPRSASDLRRGAVLTIMGRTDGALGTEAQVRGEIAGESFEATIALVAEDLATTIRGAADDLRMRWARERLRQLLLEGGTRQEVADLGVRFGIITPFTSFYVPSSAEMTALGVEPESMFGSLDLDSARRPFGFTTPTEVLLALAGCSLSGDEAVTAEGAPAAPVPTAAPTAPGVAESEEELADSAEAPGQAMQVGQLAPARDLLEAGAAPMGQAGTGARGAGGSGDVSANRYEAANEAAPSASATAAPPALARRRRRASAIASSSIRERSGAPRGDLDQAPEAEQERDEAFGDSGAGANRLGGLTSTGALFDDVSVQGEERRAPSAPSGDGTGFRGRSANNVEQQNVTATSVTATSVTPSRDSSQIRVTIGWSSQRRRQCSAASRLSLAERRQLWSERLEGQSGIPGYVSVGDEAERACELRTWTDKRALLSLIVNKVGGVRGLISLHRTLSNASSRSYVRRVALRRVRTPEDLRLVRQAFRSVDRAGLIEQVLERASTPAARVRAIRSLLRIEPDNLELRLLLLETLESLDRREEMRREAHELRRHPAADVGIRTAIGEMFLRLAEEDEARRVLGEIVEFAPTDPLARRRLGDLCRANGWFEEAYRHYQTLAELTPDDPSVWLLMAQAAAGTGRINEALELEARVVETAAPGAADGLSATALLLSSVRFAQAREQAAGDEELLGALDTRRRRSGVLGQASGFRASLVWSHPGSQLALYAGRSGRVRRPEHIAREFGIEAYETAELDTSMRVEVRQPPPRQSDGLDGLRPRLRNMNATLVMMWNEGQESERVEIRELEFTPDMERIAFHVTASGAQEVSQ